MKLAIFRLHTHSYLSTFLYIHFTQIHVNPHGCTLRIHTFIHIIHFSICQLWSSENVAWKKYSIRWHSDLVFTPSHIYPCFSLSTPLIHLEIHMDVVKTSTNVSTPPMFTFISCKMGNILIEKNRKLYNFFLWFLHLIHFFHFTPQSRHLSTCKSTWVHFGYPHVYPLPPPSHKLLTSRKKY